MPKYTHEAKDLEEMQTVHVREPRAIVDDIRNCQILILTAPARESAQLPPAHLSRAAETVQ